MSNEYDKAAKVLGMLEDAHIGWVKSHVEEFFDPDKQDQQCRFLPFELIGFEMACSYFIDVNFENLEYRDVNEKLLKRFYYLAQEDFMEQRGIYSLGELMDYIMRMDCEYVPIVIRRALWSDGATAYRMATS